MRALLVLLHFLGALANSCNPASNHSCFAYNPALGTCIFSPLVEPDSRLFGAGLNYTSDGSTLEITEQGQAPHIFTPVYIMYGRVSLDILRASGQGIVSAFYLFSDDHDEIDFELLGGAPGRAESNFFVKGNTTTYDRGRSHAIELPGGFHRYEIEWTKRRIRWYIDLELQREVPSDNTHGFPSSPMSIHLSLWAGGDIELDPWTVQWAGGPTNYKELPYRMTVRNLRVCDYSNAIAYTYGFKNGQWQPAEAVSGTSRKILSRDVLQEGPTPPTLAPREQNPLLSPRVAQASPVCATPSPSASVASQSHQPSRWLRWLALR